MIEYLDWPPHIEAIIRNPRAPNNTTYRYTAEQMKQFLLHLKCFQFQEEEINNWLNDYGANYRILPKEEGAGITRGNYYNLESIPLYSLDHAVGYFLYDKNNYLCSYCNEEIQWDSEKDKPQSFKIAVCGNQLKCWTCQHRYWTLRQKYPDTAGLDILLLATVYERKNREYVKAARKALRGSRGPTGESNLGRPSKCTGQSGQADH